MSPTAPGLFLIKKEDVMKHKKVLTGVIAVLVAGSLISAYAAIIGAEKDGSVEYIGAQKELFKTGKAKSVLALEELSGKKGLFAIGPVEGLDGEITIFDSKPYITKVRGSDYLVDTTLKHGAIFLVWTEQSKWQDIPVPPTVKSYPDLQRFVKIQAQRSGIDVTKAFPFLLAGTPVDIKWHINIDRSEGKPITRELFAKSKAGYVAKNEPVDIIGFYSENHPGEFISQYAPAIKDGSGDKNAIHIHLVSRTSKAAGHIDDITLGTDAVLRLPKL
jgi:acetolactate decarboxylase